MVELKDYKGLDWWYTKIDAKERSDFLARLIAELNTRGAGLIGLDSPKSRRTFEKLFDLLVRCCVGFELPSQTPTHFWAKNSTS